MQERIRRQMQEERPSIQVSDDGPLLVRGPVDLVDMEGDVWERETKNLALCRCGQSSDKPFCDGSHSETSFRSTPRAKETIDVPDLDRKAG